MHWFSFQIIVLVHITYRHILEYDLAIDESRILKEVHYCISNERKSMIPYLSNTLSSQIGSFESLKGVNLSTMLSRVMVVLVSLKVLKLITFWGGTITLIVNAQFPLGCQILWNYFATRHGKGEVDGAGALLKREFCKEQIKPQQFKIQNAKEVDNLLQCEVNKFHVTHPNARKIMNKTFQQVKVGDVDKSSGFHCAIVPRSQKAHQVRLVTCQDPTMLEYRNVSCFCIRCQDPAIKFPCKHAQFY